jgi:hypothetical protein
VTGLYPGVAGIRQLHSADMDTPFHAILVQYFVVSRETRIRPRIRSGEPFSQQLGSSHLDLAGAHWPPNWRLSRLTETLLTGDEHPTAAAIKTNRPCYVIGSWVRNGRARLLPVIVEFNESRCLSIRFESVLAIPKQSNGYQPEEYKGLIITRSGADAQASNRMVKKLRRHAVVA